MNIKKLPVHPHLVIQILVGGLSATIVVTAILYVAFQNISLKKEINQLKNKTNLNENLDTTGQVDALVKAVSSFMDVPKDEAPTVATILDPEALKDNPFFIKAESGDKVLVYKNAGKAILFRPSTNKVIETGSFNANSLTQLESSGVNSNPAQEPTPTPNNTLIPTLKTTPTATPTPTISKSPTIEP